MPDCELLQGCPFFQDQMKGLDSIKDMFKKKYCRGDFSDCARYIVFKALGRANVPADLIPNQVNRAKQVIAAWKS